MYIYDLKAKLSVIYIQLCVDFEWFYSDFYYFFFIIIFYYFLFNFVVGVGQKCLWHCRFVNFIIGF